MHKVLWLVRVVVAITLIGSTVGCGVFKTHNADRDFYDENSPKDHVKNDVTLPDDRNDLFLVDLSKKFGLMALFALTTYRYEMTPKDRDNFGCDYLKWDYKGDRNVGMPKHVGSDSEITRWERWVPDEPRDSNVVPCFNKDGLFYETYVHRDAKNQITEAVIAYRGTENREGQTITDWSANLSNFFGFEPDQYKIAQVHLRNLTEGLNKVRVGVPIYVVGHSLGGGLAQQAGYLSRLIKEVYTFNTSPVTNWTNLRLNRLVEQGYPIIHRVYNGGEGLAGIRSVATAGTKARNGRHDIGVQFGSKSFVSGHGMDVLVCNFAKILSDTKAQGIMHNYPISYIDRYLLAPVGENQKEAEERKKSDLRICDNIDVSKAVSIE